MTYLWPVCLGVAAVLAVVLFCALTAAGAAPEGPAPFREPNRPQYHNTPARNWMNDPNGLVYHDGEWHLFHQYNPEGDTWGHMSWAHAVSRDLVHWEHLPVALREEDGVMMFSGSAVVDRRNTSGFGATDRPPLVAIYTGHGHDKQTQNLAHSTDNGRTWTKFAGNPVIDEKLKDFRDPKVFWHGPTNRWVMAVALSDQRKVRFYGSKDLKAWEALSDFGGQGAIEGVWECPDLFELPVRGADSSRTRWVLAVSVSAGAPAGANGCQYFVGDFDGTTFRNANPKETVLWADRGPDFYAPQTWSDVPPTDGRRIWIGWMTNFRYAPVEPTSPWRGTQSLPRELTLVETKDGPRLAQSPVRELATLRGELLDPPQYAGAGQSLELELVFDPARDGHVIVCGDDAGNGTVIGYDAAERQVYVDRTKSRAGEPFHKEFPARFAAPVTPEQGSGAVATRVFVDRTSVEVFAGNGESVITANTFPDPQATRLSHAAGAKSLKVWRLNSIWKSKP